MSEHYEIHFFDVDHTVTRHSTARYLVKMGRERGLFSFWNLLHIPVLYLRYRFGSVSIESLMREIPGIQGQRREFIQELAHESFERHIKTDLIPEVVDLIGKVQAAGDRVVFATSSFDFLIRPLAEYLKVHDVIATSLEFKDGRSTGFLDGRPCFGIEKKLRVMRYLEGIGVKAGNCTFYSDSSHDLPLLSIIGKPVIVNPDRRLKREAKRQGWEFLKVR